MKSELETLGFRVKYVKKRRSLFFDDPEPTPDNRDNFKLKIIFHSKISLDVSTQDFISLCSSFGSIPYLGEITRRSSLDVDAEPVAPAVSVSLTPFS